LHAHLLCRQLHSSRHHQHRRHHPGRRQHSRGHRIDSVTPDISYLNRQQR
jgi:hypothetical protein